MQPRKPVFPALLEVASHVLRSGSRGALRQEAPLASLPSVEGVERATPPVPLSLSVAVCGSAFWVEFRTCNAISKDVSEYLKLKVEFSVPRVESCGFSGRF